MLELIRTNSENNDFKKLITELDKELSIRNGDTQFQYDIYNKIPFIETVVIAYSNEKAVGCCCFKELDSETVEIKRMYLDADFRSKGIANKMLTEVESWAAEKGFSIAVLETGYKMLEAIHLYKKMGYTQIPNYGQYADNPESICMSKSLQ
ncbi:acetyltransferase (GNAT) family protein [Dysgonomonas alginatilytica]|uniref:Acetyltransferase (GNAT) family protein n=1 Tax=Dysgonomonas alginatilytica TaxID=1605892 RepID=A0A2V3PVC0_9BACT|nr:GNAT family N-acetyltransferase [Dysgonomonas alginatilytica]PXV68846.1 acetyltransferase (GNAT) family protein [Dysgonomonas alginatilytica]